MLPPDYKLELKGWVPASKMGGKRLTHTEIDNWNITTTPLVHTKEYKLLHADLYRGHSHRDMQILSPIYSFHHCYAM
jgi:hypothetical protein